MAATTKKLCASELEKYAKRPSPPHPANDRPNETMTGNDGNQYISTPNKNGVYRWVKVKTTTTVKPVKKEVKVKTPNTNTNSKQVKKVVKKVTFKSDADSSDQSDDFKNPEESENMCTAFQKFTVFFDLGKQYIYKRHPTVKIDEHKFTFKDGRYITFTTKDEYVPINAHNGMWMGTDAIVEYFVNEMLGRVRFLKGVDVDEVAKILSAQQFKKPLKFELETKVMRDKKPILLNKEKLIKMRDHIKAELDDEFSDAPSEYSKLHLNDDNIDKFFKSMTIDSKSKKITFKNYYSDRILNAIFTKV